MERRANVHTPLGQRVCVTLSRHVRATFTRRPKLRWRYGAY